MSKSGKLQRSLPSPTCKKVSSGLTTSTTVTDWHMPGKYLLNFFVLFKFLWIWASQQHPTSLGKNMENCLSWALGFSFGTLWGSFVWAMPMLSVIFLTVAFGAMTFKSVEHAWNWLFNVHTCHYMPLHALRNLTEIVPDFNGWLSAPPGPNDLIDMPLRRTLQTIAIDCHEEKFWIPPNLNG